MTIFAQRLRHAMSIRDVKQIDLSVSTGLSKAQISSYYNGRYIPKVESIHKIAEVLNANPAWLTGFDVPMERKEYKSESSATNVTMDSFTFALYEETKDLSDEAKAALIDMAKRLKRIQN